MKNLALNLLIALLLFSAVRTKATLVTEGFLNKVSYIEEFKGRTGDHGRSRGDYQMGIQAWRDVNKLRKARKEKVYPWDAAFNKRIARVYAREYCLWLEARITSDFGGCTAKQIYAAYNVGYSVFTQVRGNILRLNQQVQLSCSIF